MTDIIIQGIHGRMGRALCTMIEARTDCRVVAGVDAKELPSAVPVFPSLEKNTVPADVLIDFSNPDATQPLNTAERTSCPASYVQRA